jgi:hypothetical protein
MSLTAWFFLLILQNAAFTWVSRARNSGSLAYHGAASVASNGVWFVSNIFLIGMVARPDMPLRTLAELFCIYVAGTTSGAVLMHYASMRWLEKGKRKVGA